MLRSPIKYSILFFLLCFSAKAQKISPYDPKGDHETWAVKGKVLPWFGIASGQGGLCGMLGVEYGFKKRHSIGIDLYFNNWHQREDRFDSTKNEYVYVYAARFRDKAVFLNYRFYFNCRRWRDSTARIPYIGSFARLGYLHSFYDKGYVTSTIYQNEMHYSSGIFFGILFFNSPKSIGGDINIGFFYKRKDIADLELENNNNVIHNSITYNFGMRLGLNLYIWNTRKNKSKNEQHLSN